MSEPKGVTPINKMSAYLDELNVVKARRIYEVLQMEEGSYRVSSQKVSAGADPAAYIVNSKYTDFSGNSIEHTCSLNEWIKNLAELAVESSVNELDIRQISIGVAALYAQKDIDCSFIASYDDLNESIQRLVTSNG